MLPLPCLTAGMAFSVSFGRFALNMSALKNSCLSHDHSTFFHTNKFPNSIPVSCSWSLIQIRYSHFSRRAAKLHQGLLTLGCFSSWSPPYVYEFWWTILCRFAVEASPFLFLKHYFLKICRLFSDDTFFFRYSKIIFNLNFVKLKHKSIFCAKSGLDTVDKDNFYKLMH